MEARLIGAGFHRLLQREHQERATRAQVAEIERRKSPLDEGARRAEVFAGANGGKTRRQAPSTVTNGVASPEPTQGLQCVETGHYAGGLFPNVILVDVDNPRIYGQAPLGIAGLVQNSPSAPFVLADQSITRGPGTGLTWTSTWSDFRLTETGGDVAPPGFLSSGSVSGPIATYPQTSGTWGLASTPATGQFPAVVEGLRVGYSSLITQFSETNTNGTHPFGSLTANIQLNPNVLLVPIEAVVIASPVAVPPFSDLSSQLALWDRVDTCNTTVETSLYGSPFFTQSTGSQGCVVPSSSPSSQLDQVTRTFTTHVANDARLGDGSGPYGVFDNYIIPDDIWAQCGIQFRLVNLYTVTMQTVPGTDGAYYESLPYTTPTGDTYDTPFEAMEDAVDGLGVMPPAPQHIPGMPVVIFPERCTFGSQSVPDIASRPNEVACVGTVPQFINGDTSTTLIAAHELGLPSATFQTPTWELGLGSTMGVSPGSIPARSCVSGERIFRRTSVRRRERPPLKSSVTCAPAATTLRKRLMLPI